MTPKRSVLLLAMLALLLALPTFAGPAPTPALAVPAPLAAPAQAGCPGADALDFAALTSPATALQALTPAATALVDPLAAIETGSGFTGYCKCSCSHIKNCSTNADCGGGACIHAITCC